MDATEEVKLRAKCMVEVFSSLVAAEWNSNASKICDLSMQEANKMVDKAIEKAYGVRK